MNAKGTHDERNASGSAVASRWPAHLSPALRKALREAKARLRETYGGRLRRVVLYGSQARGDATPESDVDVLVVLDDMSNAYQEIKRMGDIKMDLFERYRLAFSLMPYTEEAYHDMRRPFMWNVHAEGLELEISEVERSERKSRAQQAS